MLSRMPILLAALLLLAACAQSGGSSSATPSTAIFPPGKDWVPVGSQVNVQNGRVVISSGLDIVDPDDFSLSLHFGLAIAAHQDDGSARASGLTLTRAGDRPETAYAIDGLDAPADSVEVALAFIAKLYPGNRSVKGYLLNGPGTRYVGQFDFTTAAGPRRIYVDLTPWADAIKAGA